MQREQSNGCSFCMQFKTKEKGKMVNELCLVFKCKECPEQLRCVGCEHNYILIKQETNTNVYKCSKCGNKIRLNKDDVCCECVNSCKGKVQAIVDKEREIYQKCSNFSRGDKE